MTIPSTPRKAGPLLGNGVQTSWPFTFKVFADTDILVTVADNLGIESELTLTSDYTVTLNSNQETSPGGAVTYLLPDGYTLVITGDIDYDQPLDLPSGGAFSPTALENELDRLTMQIQQLREAVNRAVQAPITSNASGYLPSPQSNTLIGWNESETAMQNFPLSDIATGIAFATYRYDTFTGDGTTTSFVLSADPVTLGNIDVSVDGHTYVPGVDHTLAAQHLVFTVAPADGVEILARYGQGMASGVSGDALDISYQPAGVGAVSRTLDSRAKDTVYLLDFVPTNLHASIAAGTITTNLVPYLRAAVDSRVGGITVILPIGTTYATTLFYAGKNGVHIKGQGFAASKYKFVNAAGGNVFAGDADTTSSLAQYESCSFTDFEVVTSGNAATDPSIVVDLTSFSYSTFDLEIECRRVGATLYYGQGNAGTAPYYNRITSTGLFGGTDRTQTAFKFRSGLFSGGSNGPNANIVGPITRAANLAVLTDIRTGQGNLFNNISSESIDGGYFVLGGESAIDTGTSTGTNTDITLNDTGKAWTSAAFVNGAVQITGGTGSGQVRTIRTNTSTGLTLNEPWSTVPNATSQYSIFALTCSKNKFVNLRGEGLSSLNPDWIYSSPGADGNEFLFQSVESLGSGQYVVDYSGSVKNNWFGANKQILTFTFASPGASANLNAQPRNGVFGGLTLAGDFVVEWMKAAVDGTSHGGTATLTLDVGGSATGGGTQTLGCEIVNGNSQAMALPVGNARVIHIATNAAIHINLATDASFSAGRSVTVSVCVSLVF